VHDVLHGTTSPFEGATMPTEIERKFLVNKRPADLRQHAHAKIDQGYLCVTPEGEEVRLRRKGEACYLTVKRPKVSGLARTEVEVEISTTQFNALWPLTRGRRLQKTRYEVPINSLTIEVDVYGGTLKGLVVAEVEFASVKQSRAFTPPTWFGDEVTENTAYKNRNLAK